MPKAGRVWRIIRWWLIVLASLATTFFLVVVPWFFTYMLTAHSYHFRDPNDGKTPQDFGMSYEPVDFQSSDGITLTGWYLPAPAGSSAAQGTIVYCHGVNRTRVEMLPMAQFAHSLGYNGLVFDFRHQGASGGAISTIGYQERLDVEGAVRYALDRQRAALNPAALPPLVRHLPASGRRSATSSIFATRQGTQPPPVVQGRLEETHGPVVVWGISMGAAAALMAAAETPDVAGVISDSTFLSFEDTVRHHWKLYVGGPAFPITNEVMAWVGQRGHFRPSDFDLRTAVERINPRPILFIAVEGDKRMPPEIARTLYGVATSPAKMLVVLPGNRHGEGFSSGRDQYEQAVKEFLMKVKGP